MLLTILTPTLNCGAVLPAALATAEALEAALPGQVQHLIGDGGSTDSTWEAICTHLDRNGWARAQSLPTLNIPATLNRLLPLAQGRWVLVLNGDDRLVPTAFHACLLSLVETENAIVCGDVVVESKDGQEIGIRKAKPSRLRRAMTVNHAALLTPRLLFGTIGLFDETCSASYDYEWLWRSSNKGACMMVYPHILAHYRLGGLSTRQRGRSNREIWHAKSRAGHPCEGLTYYCTHTMTAWLSRGFKGGNRRLWNLGRRVLAFPLVITKSAYYAPQPDGGNSPKP